MATSLSPEPTETTPVLASRQPVLDARDRVVGYRMAYSLLSRGRAVAPTAEESLAIIDDAMSLVAQDEQLLGHMAHIELSREMLIRGGGFPQLPRDQVLLRLSYEDAVDPVLAPMIEAAGRSGYQLELDGVPGPDFDLTLLDYFSVVEVDISRWDLGEIAQVVPVLRARGALGLATGVSNYNARERVRRLGFQWFSGHFFATPNTIAGHAIPIGDLSAVIELYRMQRGETSLEEVVGLIQREVGLGVRLLRYINSAYFGYSGSVRSIAQAATMLGTAGLSRWALVVAVLTGPARIPTELAMMALIRARACELASLERGDDVVSDELFTIGLLSVCDAVFRMPMPQLLNELPLADHIRGALLDGSGPAGEILQAVIAYEEGAFDAPALTDTIATNATAYREALTWARGAMHGLY